MTVWVRGYRPLVIIRLVMVRMALALPLVIIRLFMVRLALAFYLVMVRMALVCRVRQSVGVRMHFIIQVAVAQVVIPIQLLDLVIHSPAF